MKTRSRRGMVIWFTGLPASGKTTLAESARRRLADAGRAVVLLDSDELRPILAAEAGYEDADRDRFYRRLAQLAARLASQDLIALVAATASSRAHREAARSLAPMFAEVYLDVPAAECERRDPKGLYGRARAGAAPRLPGAGAAYEPPRHPDVVARGGLDRAALEAIEHLVEQSVSDAQEPPP